MSLRSRTRVLARGEFDARRYGGDAYNARALVDGARTRGISLICGGREGIVSRGSSRCAGGTLKRSRRESRLGPRRRGSRDTHLDIVVGPLAEQLDVRNLSHGDRSRRRCASKRGSAARSDGKTSTGDAREEEHPRVRKHRRAAGRGKRENALVRHSTARWLSSWAAKRSRRSTRRRRSPVPSRRRRQTRGGASRTRRPPGGAAGHAKFMPVVWPAGAFDKKRRDALGL